MKVPRRHEGRKRRPGFRFTVARFFRPRQERPGWQSIPSHAIMHHQLTTQISRRYAVFQPK